LLKLSEEGCAGFKDADDGWKEDDFSDTETVIS